MGNSLRCCLACVLPCGALDLIRIVHLNGYVEEITRSITAGEILEANPNHVLSKPSSQGMVRKILILSPDSELKRGSIYFLIPSSSVRGQKKGDKRNNYSKKGKNGNVIDSSIIDDSSINDTTSYCESYLNDHVVMSEPKKSSSTTSSRKNHHRRHSRVVVWRPELNSISED